MVDRMGISQQWYDFQAEYYRKLATQWCREQELEYTGGAGVDQVCGKSEIDILFSYVAAVSDNADSMEMRYEDEKIG